MLDPVERRGPWSGGRAGVLGRDPKALGRGRELAWAHHAVAHARADAHHAQRVRNALSRHALLDELLDHALEELDQLLGGDVGPHTRLEQCLRAWMSCTSVFVELFTCDQDGACRM